jgi:ketosteroid isomerase-like protein
MKQLLIFFLFLTTNAFSQEKNDSAAIVRLLVNDYKTMGNWDIKSHIANCTGNYLLVENGEVWDIKKESEYYIKNANRVIDRKDLFDIKYVRVYGDNAYAVYHLRSDITENGELKVKTWIESTIFRKIKGKWKIELINSTPVELKK